MSTISPESTTKPPRTSAAERARRLLEATGDTQAPKAFAPGPDAPAAAVAAGVSLVAAAALMPYARNARTHSPEQVAALAQSIRAFGLAGALVVRDGTIAKGHGTLAACQRLFADGEPVYPVPGQARGASPYPFGHLPVQDATGWSDAEFRAFVIADNQHALVAGWDADLLASEVMALKPVEFDLPLLAFTPVEIAEMEFRIAPPTETLIAKTAPRLDQRAVVPCPHCGKNINEKPAP